MWSLPLQTFVKIVMCCKEEQKTTVYQLKLFLLLWTKEEGSKEKHVNPDWTKIRIPLYMVRVFLRFDFTGFSCYPK